MTGKVLVTGGSGYIAGFLIQQLLEAGWTVNTTVRSLVREAELRPLLGGTPESLRFFAADLLTDEGWAEAMAGCSHVAHVASPFHAEAPKHEDDLIIPAREGVLRALRYARDAGVTRFVQTSSMAAIAYGHGKGEFMFTEQDWTNVDGGDVYAYVKSKTLAERAARDWTTREGGALEFVSSIPAPSSARSGARTTRPPSRSSSNCCQARFRAVRTLASGLSMCVTLRTCTCWR